MGRGSRKPQKDCNYSIGYGFVGGRWGPVLKAHAVLRLHQMIDEIEDDPREIISHLSAMFRTGSYTDVLGFIQFVLRQPHPPVGLSRSVELTLQNCRAAYRLVEGHTLVPIGSPEEGEAILGAVTAASKSGQVGARAHLLSASAKLSSGDYPGSIRESIHAVEAVARTLEPSAASLEPALLAAVDEIDAVYMLGSCASFVTYLIGRVAARP